VFVLSEVIMKSTRLKISVSQDGLLPQETAEIATLDFPALPKKLLKALGFERVDSRTYVGVLPVFINLGEKDQEIEIELGVTLPEMRKKIMEIVKTPARLIAAAKEAKAASEAKSAKKAETKTAAKAPAKPKTKAEPKTTAKAKTAAKAAPKTEGKTPSKAKPKPKTTAKTQTKTTTKTTAKRTTKR